MIEALGVAYGGSLFVAVNVLVAYIAHLVGRRLLPSAGLPARLSASGLVFLAAILLIAQFLALFGLYNRNVVALVVVVAALIVHRAWGSLANVRGDAAVVRQWARETAASKGAILIVMTIVALGVSAWRAVSQTPMGWDSLTYHLPFAASYVQTGRLQPLVGPMAMDHYAHFPKNAEIVVSWLMLPFHGDLVVGLMNLCLLIFCWIATVAVARELELAPGDAALAATAVCASPFLYSYATTQNADTLVYGALTGAVLFCVRFLSSGAGVDALLMALAVGVAVGAKYTALPVGAMVLGAAAVSAFASFYGSRCLSRMAVWILVVVVTIGTWGGRQYVLNTVATRNPIYPLTVGLGNLDVLPGSPYTEWLVDDLGPGDRNADRSAVLELFHYFPSWAAPMSAGPKYLVFIALTIVALLRGKERRTGPLRLLVAFAAVGLAATLVPGSGLAALSRRFWPGSVARLAGVSLGLFAVTGLTVLSRLDRWRADLLRGVVVAYIFWDFMVAGATFATDIRVLVGAAAVAAALAIPRLRVDRRWLPGLAAVSLVALVAVLIPALDARRLATRWAAIERADEPDVAPRTFLQGWRFSDQAGPLTIAFATGPDRHGQNWFIYPLMGRRLQHTVTYVPLNQSDPPGSRAFVRRENPRFAEWLSALEQRQVELVCVQAPWPIEDEWMRENPVRFALVFDGPHFRAYETDVLADRSRR